MNIIQPDTYKQLILDLMKTGGRVKMRVRLKEKLWSDEFMKVAIVSGKATIFERSDDAFFVVTDLDEIAEFQLDHTFNGFHHRSHYCVKRRIQGGL